MRARIFGAFAIGIAAGALILALLLWRSGSLGTRAAAPVASPTNQSSLPPLAVDPLPDTKEGPRYHGAADPPPFLPTPQPAPALSETPPVLSNADRAARDAEPPRELESRHLLLPVMGVNRTALIDTFNDARGGGSRRHEALDIMAPRGTPVIAADEGNVVKLFESKQGGLTVYQFDNSNTWCYYYAHLDRYAENLKEGVLLRKGETLGYVGSTGDADPAAPHLHFAIFRLGPEKRWWKGTPVNPYPLFFEE